MGLSWGAGGKRDGVKRSMNWVHGSPLGANQQAPYYGCKRREQQVWNIERKLHVCGRE